MADIKFANGSKETAIAMPKGSTALQEKVNASIKDIQDTGLLKKYQKKPIN